MKLKVGDTVTPKYKGEIIAEYKVIGIAKLGEPRHYITTTVGEEVFNPTIVLLEATTDAYPELGKGHKEVWFPYWITRQDKERYGQFAPMLTEKVFLELLKEAIKQGFFSKDFLKDLAYELEGVLRK